MQKHIKIVLFVAVLALVLAALLGLSVNAQTWDVDDESSLTDAIDAAASGDTINITDDITVTSAISITKDLTFTGTSGMTLQNATGGLFSITGSVNVTLTLKDITFSGTTYVVSGASSGIVDIVAENCAMTTLAPADAAVTGVVWLDGTGVMNFTATDTTITGVVGESTKAHHAFLVRKGGSKAVTLTDCTVTANDNAILLETPARINISGGTLSDATLAAAQTYAVINVSAITASGTQINITDGATLTSSHFRQGVIRLHGYADVTIGSDVTITDTKASGTKGPAIGASNQAIGSDITVMNGASLTGANGTAIGSINAAAEINSAAGSGRTVYSVDSKTTGNVVDVADATELANAVSGAASGDTIRLTANITMTAALEIAQNITITADSAYTLSLSTSSKPVFQVTAAKTVALTIAGSLKVIPANNYRVLDVNHASANVIFTIQDNAVVGTAQNAVYVQNAKSAIITVRDSGTLYSATAVNNFTSGIDAVHFMSNTTGATYAVNVKDNATVIAKRHAIRVRLANGYDGSGVRTSTVINVSGGTVTTGVDNGNATISVGVSHSASEGSRSGVTTVNVSGGTISYPFDSGVCGAIDFFSKTEDAVNVFNMTGGTVSCAGRSAVAFRKATSVNYVTISGGTLSTAYTAATEPNGVLQCVGNTTLKMTGGTITETTVHAKQSGIRFADGTHKAEILGGTVEAGSLGIYIPVACSTIDLTVGGDAEIRCLNEGEGATGYGILMLASGDGSIIRIQDDAFIDASAPASGFAVRFAHSGTATRCGTVAMEITGGYLFSNAQPVITAFKPSGLTSLSISNATLEGTYAARFFRPVDVTIGAGTVITASAYGIQVDHTEDGTVGDDEATFDGSTITITGGTFNVSDAAVRTCYEANTAHTITVTGGTFNGNVGVRNDAASTVIAINGGDFAGCGVILYCSVDTTGAMNIGTTGVSLTLPSTYRLFTLAAAGDTQPTVMINNALITPFSLNQLNFYDTEAHAAASVVAYIGTWGQAGTAYYSSLAAAVEAAADGDTIKIYRDETLTAAVEITLAGTLTITSHSNSAVAITTSGKIDVFAIKASTTLNLTGNVVYTCTGDMRVININTAGISPNVTVGGNVQLIHSGDKGFVIWFGSNLTDNTQTVSLTVEENASLSNSNVSCFCICSSASCESAVSVTITGGTFYSPSKVIYFVGTGTNTLAISGGTLTSPDAVIQLTSASTADIAGGTFNGRIYVGSEDAASTLNIYGGKFNHTTESNDLAKVKKGEINVYGGTFTLVSETCPVFTEENGTVNLVCGYVIQGGTTYLTGKEYPDANNIYTGDIITRDTGAQVRLDTTRPGLRFISHIDADLVNAVASIPGVSNIEYYTIIFPADHLTTLDGDVTPQNIFAKLTVTTQYAQVKASAGIEGDGNGGYYIRTALVGIQDYTRDFACVAYIRYNVNGMTAYQSTVFDAENDVRNIQDVALAALASGSYNAEQTAILNEFAYNDAPTVAMFTIVSTPAGKKQYV